MALKNMKLTAADQKAKKEGYNGEGWPPKDGEYPYGLTLRLEDGTLVKLGMDKLPKVGTKMRIEAVGVVTEVRSSQRRSGANDRCVEIQIQKMEVEAGGAPGSAEEAVEEGIEDATEY